MPLFPTLMEATSLTNSPVAKFEGFATFRLKDALPRGGAFNRIAVSPSIETVSAFTPSSASPRSTSNELPDGLAEELANVSKSVTPARVSSEVPVGSMTTLVDSILDAVDSDNRFVSADASVLVVSASESDTVAVAARDDRAIVETVSKNEVSVGDVTGTISEDGTVSVPEEDMIGTTSEDDTVIAVSENDVVSDSENDAVVAVTRNDPVSVSVIGTDVTMSVNDTVGVVSVSENNVIGVISVEDIG